MSRQSVFTSVVAGGSGSPFDSFILPGQAYSIRSTAAIASPVASGPHTDGSWVSLGGATSRRYDALVVRAFSTAGGYEHMLEIGVDPAGGTSYSAVGYHMVLEVVGSTGMGRWFVPVNVTSGSTLAVRSRHDVNGSSFGAEVSVTGISYTTPPSAPPVCTEVGYNLGTTRLTALGDAGGTANTFGAWTQLTASSSAAFKGFIPQVMHRQSDANTGEANFIVEIGTGAAASEVTVAAFTAWTQDFMGTGVAGVGEVPIPFPSTIAAGTRISARYMTTTNIAGARSLDAAIVGLSA